MQLRDWLEEGVRQTARIRRSPAYSVTLGVTVFAVAVALRFALGPLLPSGLPYITFFPAVIVATAFGGGKAGAVCALLSFFGAWLWFFEPPATWPLPAHQPAAMAVFGLSIALLILALDQMHHAMDKLVAEREATEALAERHRALAERQRQLFQELQHRVANNLAMIGALIRLQQSRLDNQPEAKAALDDVRLRMETMSKVHRQLYDPDKSFDDFSGHLRDICSDVVKASGRTDIDCRVTAAELRLNMEQLVTLSLFVVEAVTNAVKHAFDGLRPGCVVIDLRPVEDGRCQLTVRDDGPGIPADFQTTRGARLGARILTGLAHSLEGELSFANEGGAVLRLVFPCQVAAT